MNTLLPATMWKTENVSNILYDLAKEILILGGLTWRSLKQGFGSRPETEVRQQQ